VLRKPVVPLLLLTIFAGEAMWNAMVPLVPEYSQRFDLSKLQAGILLGSGSVAILLVSIPAGLLGERIGVRRVTLASVAVIAVADAAQALAGSFWTLLAARALFGLAFGVLWTTGIAWLSQAGGERQSQLLSLAVTTAGVGGVAGPGMAGIVGERYGLGAPFAVVAGITAGLAGCLALASDGERAEPAAPAPASAILRAAFADRQVSAGLLLMTVGGLVSSTINLLVPLSLHRSGVSTGAVGGVIAASAGVFIACSALIARLGDRAVRVGVGAAACLAAAVVLSIPEVSGSAAAGVAFVFARAPVTAVLFTVSFPLSVAGARGRGVSVTAVAALLNIVWAGSALVGPVAGGALAEAAGNGAAYAVLIVLSLAAAGWMARAAGGARAPAACVSDG
jgi:predicted MFS family arabinose efflux permease